MKSKKNLTFWGFPIEKTNFSILTLRESGVETSMLKEKQLCFNGEIMIFRF